MIKEALYWQNKGKYVQCQLCHHNCLISLNRTGICKVRKNIDGKLFTSAYANICALSIDPIEKKPLYHFLPGTKTLSLAHAGCNLHCLNCQNSHISQEISFDGYPYTPEKIVYIAKEKACPSISYTYTEPTIFYEYVLETAKLAHRLNIKNILVTNGYINPEPLSELIPFIDAVNIDVKAFDNNVYKKLTGAKLKPILENILELHRNKIHIELTYLLVPEYSDDKIQIENFINWLIEQNLRNIPLHFSRFFPSYELKHLPPTPLTHLNEAYLKAKERGIQYVYVGNADIIDNSTICPYCGKNIIYRKGYNADPHGIKKNSCSFCGNFIYGYFN